MPAHSLGATCQAGARFLTCERRLAGTRTRSSTESPSGRCEIGTADEASRSGKWPTHSFPALHCTVHDAGKTGLSSRESTCVYAATKAEKLSGGAPAAWRREVVMRAAALRTSRMRAAAFQFFGNLSELGRKFEQRLPRVDLRRRFRELQAFFGMLAAFFRRRHGGDPTCATSVLAISFRLHCCG